ncbi:Protein MAIN-LIKE 2 [Glycine soja]
MYIMVRTRGLCRALGKVVGRALGREDNRDSDESLQQRRPTTSARRHREIAAVAEESPHLDDAAEEVFQQPEGVVVDDQGFPGGPRDTSVLTAYADHVVVIVCNGELSSYGRQVHKFGRPATEIEGPLVQHKETSSFHLPVGEVVITLNDVASLLHLPIIGAFHSFETLHVDEAVLMLVELREVSEDEVKAQTVQCHGAYSATHVHVVFLDTFRDLYQSESNAWGAASLVHMYNDLNNACKSDNIQLVVYITLLQCWIYEHFPSVAEGFTDEDYDERSPCAYHWTYTKALPASTYRKRLDRLTTANVCWMPYGAIMQLETLTRFHTFSMGSHCCHTLTREGCVVIWTIPPYFPGSRLCVEDIDDRWMHFSDYLAPWFYMILHPFMRLTQLGDPPKHPPIVQDETYVEPDMPQYLVVAAAMEEAFAHAPSDLEQPRHAMEACQAIAERLERLFNLRIVTEGTKTYVVMQDCLRIARGVTVDHNVYVMSRRRGCYQEHI